MKRKPIFDTNIFGHVHNGSISQKDWHRLLRSRPHRGWPLSSITALELLAGIHDVPPDKFSHLRDQVGLAFTMSNGRVLEEPLPLLCREVLHVPFPPSLTAPSAPVLSQYLDVVRRATTLRQILENRVPYKGGAAGFRTTSVLNDLVVGLKNKWIEGVEQIATDTYPFWRVMFQEQGRRLPQEMRWELQPSSAWKTQKRNFIEQLLRWLEADTEPALVDEMMTKLDAVLEFTTFVVREFLTRDYSLRKHESDVYDQFQLRYLAMDRFVIVTGDSDLFARTRRSAQADRIITFGGFLQTL